MKQMFCLILLGCIACSSPKTALTTTAAADPDAGWIPLFDGKTFNGWSVGNNAATFRVDSGMIIVNGLVAHLFYTGDVKNHEFKNFEFKVSVMTTPGSNSGIYFHT